MLIMNICLSRDYKGKVMFVSVTTDEKEHQKVLEFFGIWDVPTYRYIHHFYVKGLFRYV